MTFTRQEVLHHMEDIAYDYVEHGPVVWDMLYDLNERLTKLEAKEDKQCQEA